MYELLIRDLIDYIDDLQKSINTIETHIVINQDNKTNDILVAKLEVLADVIDDLSAIINMNDDFYGEGEDW